MCIQRAEDILKSQTNVQVILQSISRNIAVSIFGYYIYPIYTVPTKSIPIGCQSEFPLKRSVQTLLRALAN